jgi:hypothetical protein
MIRIYIRLPGTYGSGKNSKINNGSEKGQSIHLGILFQGQTG